MTTRSAITAALLAGLLCLVIVPGGAVFAGTSGDDQVKAAFIERFLNFVTWSGGKADTDTLVIGVAADTALTDALTAWTVPVAGRPIVLRTADSPGDLARGCHVVFIPAVIDGIPRNQHPDWNRLAWTAPYGVLTIGEDEAFLADGGVIGFYTEDDRLHFTISEGAADHAGLVFGSKLLRLAKVVP